MESDDEGPTVSQEDQNAIANLLREISTLEVLKGTEHPQTLVLVINLAKIYYRTRQLTNAKQYFERAFCGAERTHGKKHIVVFRVASTLGNCLKDMFKYVDAEMYLRKGLSGLEMHLGMDHPDLLEAMEGLGDVLYFTSRYDECYIHFQCALELRLTLYGNEDKATLNAVNNVAKTLNALNRFADAIGVCNTTYENCVKLLGPYHPVTLGSIESLAYVLQATGDNEKAMEMYRMSFEGNEKVLGKYHLSTITSIRRICFLLQLKPAGCAEAEELYFEALKRIEKVQGDIHPETLTVVYDLGIVLKRQEKLIVGEQMLRRAMVQRRKELGQSHPDTLCATHELASLLYQRSLWKHTSDFREKQVESFQLYEDCIDRREAMLGKHHTRTCDAIEDYANALLDQQLYDRACYWYDRLLDHVLTAHHKQSIRIAGGTHSNPLPVHYHVEGYHCKCDGDVNGPNSNKSRATSPHLGASPGADNRRFLMMSPQASFVNKSMAVRCYTTSSFNVKRTRSFSPHSPSSNSSLEDGSPRRRGSSPLQRGGSSRKFSASVGLPRIATSFPSSRPATGAGRTQSPSATARAAAARAAKFQYPPGSANDPAVLFGHSAASRPGSTMDGNDGSCRHSPPRWQLQSSRREQAALQHSTAVTLAANGLPILPTTNDYEAFNADLHSSSSNEAMRTDFSKLFTVTSTVESMLKSTSFDSEVASGTMRWTKSRDVRNRYRAISETEGDDAVSGPSFKTIYVGKRQSKSKDSQQTAGNNSKPSSTTSRTVPSKSMNPADRQLLELRIRTASVAVKLGSCFQKLDLQADAAAVYKYAYDVYSTTSAEDSSPASGRNETDTAIKRPITPKPLLFSVASNAAAAKEALALYTNAMFMTTL